MIIYESQSVRVNFNIGSDTTLIDEIKLNYRKPDGTEGLFSPVVIEDVAKGDIYYDADVGDFDTVGTWTLWSESIVQSDTFIGHPFFVEVNPIGTSITNKDFVKDHLGITVDTFDTKIENYILMTEQDYLKIRNIPFSLDADGNTVYPIGSNVTISEMIGYKLSTNKFASGTPFGVAKQSESIDAYSVSFGDSLAGGVGGYPKGIVSSIKRYCDGR